MLKKCFFLGLVSGISAGLSSVVYASVYSNTMGVDFSKIVKPTGLVGASDFGALLAAAGYFLASKLLKAKTDAVFNIVFLLLTFASCIGPFAANLPLTVNSPELFPGLVIPMHFFPFMFWVVLKPFFFKSEAAR
jgi:hypothetical protein